LSSTCCCIVRVHVIWISYLRSCSPNRSTPRNEKMLLHACIGRLRDSQCFLVPWDVRIPVQLCKQSQISYSRLESYT
jgi:hypothetical protein